MRIALVHYSYAPVIGGVERVVAEHARLFTEAGHEVTVVCRRGASDDPRILVELLEPKGDEELQHLLQQILRGKNLVIVHNVCTMPFDAPLTRALWNVAAQLASTRFVSWIHDLAAANPDVLPEQDCLLARASPSFEYVAVSEPRRQLFQDLTRAECRVIPNGVDPSRLLGLSDRVAQLARERRLLLREAVLLHPTRVLRRKNIGLSLHVTAALRNAGCDACMLITAPPDLYNEASKQYAASLRGLRTELQIEDDVIFLHEHFEVNDEELHSLWRIADGLFFPSRQEGFGLPILEAAVHRLPIFCTDLAPMNSLLAGFVHTFKHDAEPNAIAGQIITSLENSRETQARKIVARDYDWQAIYEKFLAPLLAETQFSTRL